MADIVQTLINASEKAACIARSCVGVSDDALLVAEKSEGEANTRFDKDFKTIADVLAQEAAKISIVSKYPVLANHVRGEECSEIDGKNIKVLETVSETSELLSSLVTSNLAERMAEAAHNSQHIHVCHVDDDLPELDISDLGVWIDPIDATAEFIAGVRGEAKAGEGLECVTVLIGAYLRSTGEPVIGIINQPFYKNGEGRLLWGVSHGSSKKWGGKNIDTKTKCSNTILMSNAEDSEVKAKFADSNYSIDTAPGAGYKLMKVCLGEADAYLLSKGTTFRWDTCAPHAVLKATGGDIISFQLNESIKYNVPESNNQEYCNSGGIIAYKNDDTFNKILAVLQ